VGYELDFVAGGFGQNGFFFHENGDGNEPLIFELYMHETPYHIGSGSQEQHNQYCSCL
jgi:hypothetical protein